MLMLFKGWILIGCQYFYSSSARENQSESDSNDSFVSLSASLFS